jgi:hypothetical protein
MRVSRQKATRGGCHRDQGRWKQDSSLRVLVAAARLWRIRDGMLMWAGRSVTFIKDLPAAGELVERLGRECEAAGAGVDSAK